MENDPKSTCCLRPCSYPGIWPLKEVKMAKQGEAQKSVGFVKNPLSSGHLKISVLLSREVRARGLEFPHGKHHGQGAALLLPAAAHLGGHLAKREPCSCCAPHTHCSQPSHFQQADLTFPQHKLLSSASPHGFQRNLSPCFPAVM